jgi:hypothetical protein
MMKTLSYITIISLLLTFKGYAQNTESKGPVVHFGGKAGALLTKATGENMDSKRKWGYQVGGYATIDLIPNFGVQAEALYSRSVLQLTGTENPGKDNTILKTWDFPLLLRLNAGEAFTFNIGPQFSHFISSKGFRSEVQNKDFANKKVSYIVGVELGSKSTGGRMYARYNWNNKNIGSIINNASSNQFQFGLLMPLY